MNYKAGFIGIIGKPNAGKSTLMNALVGEKLSIITPKEQTTRHKIIGIHTTEKYQMIFFDSPGITQPTYGLHHKMMNAVEETMTDADVIIVLTDGYEKDADLALIKEKILKKKQPLLFVLNKTDLFEGRETQLEERKKRLEDFFGEPFIPVSADKKLNLEFLLEEMEKRLPFHPAFYGDDLSDRSERFFVAEMIREKIFLYYREEIPYSSEVQVIEFKEKEDLTVIRTEIYVERESQKAILIGNKGLAMKKIGVEARKDIEKFLQKKIFLELTVKVKDNWRNDERMLQYFGYKK